MKTKKPKITYETTFLLEEKDLMEFEECDIKFQLHNLGKDKKIKIEVSNK